MKKIYNILIIAMLMVLSPNEAMAKTAASLTIENFSISAGETKEMIIDLNNPDDVITLIQFDLKLPSNLSVAMEGGEFAIDIAGRTTWRQHSLAANALDGVTRFLLSSQTNAAISGTSGAVISIKLTATPNFNGGDIVLTNQTLVTPDETATTTKPADYTYTVMVVKTADNIAFADATVKSICVQNWDTDGDGELSKEEAAAVTDIGTKFRLQEITSFDEFQYFTGVTELKEMAFYGCDKLESIKLPSSLETIGSAAFSGCSKLKEIVIPESALIPSRHVTLWRR